jgi:TRAP-type uncharacterized transport system substrate-binding protein
MTRLRSHWVIVACLFGAAFIAAIAAFAYSWQLTLRVAVGPQGGDGQRFFSALVPIMSEEHPRVRLTSVQSDDLAATAKALESGEVDLAIIRDDIAIPTNGRTILVLRRDPVVLVVPANSAVEKMTDLQGKAVAILRNAAQPFNARILDRILAYLSIPLDSVTRMPLAPGEIGQAFAQQRIAAVLVVGPRGAGPVADVLASVTKAGAGAPRLLAVDEARAIVQQSPGIETIELDTGALQGNPRAGGRCDRACGLLSARGAQLDAQLDGRRNRQTSPHQ